MATNNTDKWSNLLPCCKDDNDTGGTKPTSCLEQWEADKKETENLLNKQKAEAAKAEAKYLNSSLWEAKLKLFLDNIKTSQELADRVLRELIQFKNQVDKVCDNADCTVEAIKILYFDVLAVFEKANEIKNSLGAFPGIKGLIDKIDELEDPGLPKDKGIRKCLEDFRVKLAAVLEIQTEAFKKVLEALKCANLLLEMICEDENGLKANLASLATQFGDSDGIGGVDSLPPNGSCKATLIPKPSFPIEKGSYYLETESEYGLAMEETKDAKKRYDTAREDRDVLQACYDSLCLAIEASKSAKNCK